MPELPEVETIRAQLAPRLEGRVLERVEILDPRLTRPNDLFEVAEELEGDRVAAVERRGKYLVVRLESGLALLVHLRMTGGFGWEPASHERAVIELAEGLGYTVRAKRLTRDDIYIADECFFTGTAAEVTPIRELDSRVIGAGKAGPVTKKLQKAFFDVVTGKDKKHAHWLTPVPMKKGRGA